MEKSNFMNMLKAKKASSTATATATTTTPVIATTAAVSTLAEAEIPISPTAEIAPNGKGVPVKEKVTDDSEDEEVDYGSFEQDEPVIQVKVTTPVVAPAKVVKIAAVVEPKPTPVVAAVPAVVETPKAPTPTPTPLAPAVITTEARPAKMVKAPAKPVPAEETPLKEPVDDNTEDFLEEEGGEPEQEGEAEIQGEDQPMEEDPNIAQDPEGQEGEEEEQEQEQEPEEEEPASPEVISMAEVKAKLNGKEAAVPSTPVHQEKKVDKPKVEGKKPALVVIESEEEEEIKEIKKPKKSEPAPAKTPKKQTKVSEVKPKVKEEQDVEMAQFDGEEETPEASQGKEGDQSDAAPEGEDEDVEMLPAAGDEEVENEEALGAKAEAEEEEVVEEVDEYGRPQAPAPKNFAPKRKHAEIKQEVVPGTIRKKTADLIDKVISRPPMEAFNYLYSQLMEDTLKEEIFESFIASTGKINHELFIESLRLHDGLKGLNAYSLNPLPEAEEDGPVVLRFTPKQLLMLRYTCWLRTFNVNQIPSSRASKPGVNDTITPLMHMMLLKLPAMFRISKCSEAFENFMELSGNGEENQNSLNIKQEASLLSWSVIQNSDLNRIINMSEGEMFAMSGMLVESLVSLDGGINGNMINQEITVSRMLEVLATLKSGRSPLYNMARRWFESYYSNIIMNFLKVSGETEGSDSPRLRTIVSKAFVNHAYAKHKAEKLKPKDFVHPNANKPRDVTVMNNLVKMQLLALMMSISHYRLEGYLARQHREDVPKEEKEEKEEVDEDGNAEDDGESVSEASPAESSSQVSGGKKAYSYRNMKDGTKVVVIQDMGTFRVPLSEFVRQRKTAFVGKSKSAAAAAENAANIKSVDPKVLSGLMVGHARTIYLEMLRAGIYNDLDSKACKDSVMEMSKMVSNLKWVAELFKKVLLIIATSNNKKEWTKKTFFRIKDRMLFYKVPMKDTYKNAKGAVVKTTPDGYLLADPSETSADPSEFDEELSNFNFAIPTFMDLTKLENSCKEKLAKNENDDAAKDTLNAIELLQYLACIAICKINGNALQFPC